MSDEKETNPPVPQHFMDLLEALHAFQEVIWKQGYDAGWADGKKFIAEKIAEDSARPAPTKPPSQTVRVDTIAAMSSISAPAISKSRPPSANKVVLQVIKDNPGLRGVDLLDRVRATAEPNMHERTFRTALHRLKTGKEQKIQIVDGRWYVSGEAPADPEPTLPGVSDASP